jgi:hypothetical protein
VFLTPPTFHVEAIDLLGNKIACEAGIPLIVAYLFGYQRDARHGRPLSCSAI